MEICRFLRTTLILLFLFLPFQSIAENQLIKTKDNGEAINEKSILDFNINYETELATVIYDEAHYLFTDRGAAWNNSIVHLTNHMPIICLSATVEKPDVLCNWITNATGNNKTILCENNNRIVPLEHKSLLFINLSDMTL